MNVFLDFHARGKLKRSLKGTFISLIPKIIAAVNLKDFQPFNLVSGVYLLI
jgi:hypothetical protein